MKNFNIRSSQQIATLLFGGEVKNEIVEPILTETGEFKYTKKGELKTHKVTVKEQIKGLGLKCPKQTPSGKNSTDDEVLSQLNHPLVKDLLEFRKVDKLHSTYYEGFQDCVYPDHLVHAEIQLETTATGRTSCRNPNLQNQPEQAGKLIKSHFTSRFGSNGTFVKCDYSQIEVCVQAGISNDWKYIDDITNGVDFHIKWVAISENLDYKEVESKIKIEKKEEWINKRKRIKPVTFSMNYGASAWALSRDSGIPQYEIEKIIAGFEDEYFQLKQYYEDLEDVLEFTKEQAYVYGRWAHKGWYQSPTGRKYFFVTRESKYGDQYFHKPEYMNYIVQGSTFDIVAIMIGKMWREKAIHNRDKYLMINFVHDEIDFDCKKEHLEQLVSDCHQLTEVKEMMQEKFNFDFKVPIRIEVKAGESWSDCE